MTLLIVVVDEHTIRFYHEPVEASLLAELINSGRTALDPGLIPGGRWKAVAENGVVVAFSNQGAREPGAPAELLVLTRREQQVLAGIAAGHTYRQIGALLGIHPQTVASCAGRLRRRLRAATSQEAVLRARNLGLIDPKI